MKSGKRCADHRTLTEASKRAFQAELDRIKNLPVEQRIKTHTAWWPEYEGRASNGKTFKSRNRS